MNYGELKTRLAAVSHRADLAASMPDFVEDARVKINGRFGMSIVPFVNDTDTNMVLLNFPLLYTYAALQSLYEHLNNGDSAVYYRDLWNYECSNQNINAASGITDPYFGAPPVILPGTTQTAATGGNGQVPDPLTVNELTTNNLAVNASATLPYSTTVGAVSSTELSYLAGVVSPIQAQIDIEPLAKNTVTAGLVTGTTVSAGTLNVNGPAGAQLSRQTITAPTGPGEGLHIWDGITPSVSTLISVAMHIVGTDNDTTTFAIERSDTSINSSATIYMLKQTATGGLPDSNNNMLGTYAWGAGDSVGGLIMTGAAMMAFAETAWTSSSTPGYISLRTTPNDSKVPVERMRVKSTGVISMPGLPVYADNAAATAGGLLAGDIYRTSTGVLLIRY